VGTLPDVSPRVSTTVLQTTNGVHWLTQSGIPRTSEPHLYGSPSASDGAAVLPVFSAGAKKGTGILSLATSTNQGSSWRAGPALSFSQILAKTFLYPLQLGVPDIPAVAARSSAVAWASWATGDGRVHVARLVSGTHWSVVDSSGLPRLPIAADLRGGGPPVMDVYALGPRSAVVNLYVDPAQQPQSYVTANGGHTWSHVSATPTNSSL
jgi:hypothetical protein